MVTDWNKVASNLWDFLRKKFKAKLNEIFGKKGNAQKRLIAILEKKKGNIKNMKKLFERKEVWEGIEARESKFYKGYERKGVQVKAYSRRSFSPRWTKKEVAKVHTWTSKGRSDKQISSWLGRTISSVKTKRERLHLLR
jgi:hypothetical protein